MRNKSFKQSYFPLLFVFWFVTLAYAHDCPIFTKPPIGTPGNTVIQEFPPGGPMQTAWKVRFAHAQGKGLYITGAWFKKAPGEAWMRVLWDARLADIFVPYHPGSPRYYDLTNFNFPLVNATAADAGPCGKIIDGKVIHQVRNRGLMWKDDTKVRYGHELALWATLDSANYNYVMSFAFRDDGTVALRLGATSRNHPSMEHVAHMHNGLWRIDMDLNGYSSDSVYEASHIETINASGASDNFVPFNGGVEGFADWNALKFTELHVRDPKKNGLGNQISYEFRPFRRGSPRHKEAFAHHDFWVTRYRGSEQTYKNVDSYINGESVMKTDIVIWHISPLHHDPRDEDGYFDGPYWKGVALLMWGGIDLRPRNLFDKTPLFP
jgi:Cu2+-containing amine oxidase